MQHALVSGKVFRDPEARVSKAGKNYATGTIRVSLGGETTYWWTVLAFDPKVVEELLELHDGDSVSVTGSFTVEPRAARDGKLGVNLRIFADKLIGNKPKKRERKARIDSVEAQRPLDPEKRVDPDLDDGIGF